MTILEQYKYDLLKVRMPGRYVGGEFGCINYEEEQPLKIALSFPDLYEIAMSNQALKIMYNLFNEVEGVQCERVFAAAPDFEALLKEKNIPLFTLESAKSLKEFDIITFTIGYELCLTNMLAMLDLAGIPLKAEERGEDDPIIIVGGPAATNPASIGEIVDFVCIAEAEAVYPDLLKGLVELKKEGRGRKELFEEIFNQSYIWHREKKERTRRVFWSDFGRSAQKRTHLPVASIAPVQDQGVVEIMRGCPTGCRFCHAGVYYRPFRQKEMEHILKEVDDLVHICGYRTITLSSLSSGDYQGIYHLVRGLNKRYKHLGVSFSLPSLRVNSITLPLIEELSTVRKSGLTFALETPKEGWQRGLNKEVPRERIIEILLEAKARGWKLAKFYFMVGLPAAKGEDETGPIIELVKEIQQATGMKMNVNIGVFIPKPHTPYQWAPQFNDASGYEKLIEVKKALKSRFIKVNFHSPFISFIEGVFTRGDHRVNDLLIRAYEKGARLDAWDEWIKKDLWKEVFEESDWDVEGEICRARDLDEPLPWQGVSLLESDSYMKKELKLSDEQTLTSPCDTSCDHLCGVCTKKEEVQYAKVLKEFEEYEAPEEGEKGEFRKVIFRYKKSGRAIYIPHLDTMTLFERAFSRSGASVRFTEGFNPKPKLEFAHPLTLGMESDCEIFGMELYDSWDDLMGLMNRLNQGLPEGFEIDKAYVMNLIPEGRKYKKLMALYAGSDYEIHTKNSSLRAGELISLAESRLEELDVKEDYEFNLLDENSIQVRCLFRNKKMNNIFKFLTEITGDNPLTTGYDIKRINCYALSKKGKLMPYSDVK